jgi:hypothetical protein
MVARVRSRTPAFTAVVVLALLFAAFVSVLVLLIEALAEMTVPEGVP